MEKKKRKKRKIFKIFCLKGKSTAGGSGAIGLKVFKFGQHKRVLTLIILEQSCRVPVKGVD